MTNKPQWLEATNNVIRWNQQRYRQEYDYNLANKLLREEISEFATASGLVGRADAIGDIAFVLIGMLWKLEFQPEFIADILADCDPENRSVCFDSADVAHKINELMMYLHQNTNCGLLNVLLINAGLEALFCTGWDYLNMIGENESMIAILNIICESNATKSVPDELVSKDVKCNIEKGPDYVSPEPALKELFLEV
ncbi:MAG: hypothetical protein K0U41_09085 [Gammaproteobacteria bacterium]|nr:hypothetical protein [Gammaproteobacteria bacterium]